MQLRAFFFVHWFLPVQGDFDQQQSKIEYEDEFEFEDDREGSCGGKRGDNENHIFVTFEKHVIAS